MYLDEMLAAQKRGEARGTPSICSAHPVVLRQALRALEHPLIEATCNQVNQFGGYTGMRPQDFVAFVRAIADDSGVAVENILLGGDHLGPHVWQGEPAAEAMTKAEEMITEYARAGFTKLHLDCSMRLADDSAGALEPEIAAHRAAELAKVAEQASASPLQYVIGTEVPRPGGALASEEGLHVTEVQDVQETIEIHRRAFREAGLVEAWERVMAVVVQPGVEFGDDFVTPYIPESARELSRFIEREPLVYEAHSTDYQSRDALGSMVRDHFAILKVGPALTFAYREAVFALAMIEDECLPNEERSHLIEALDECMLEQPGHWKPYYPGTEQEQAFKRKYSLSDRARYYWSQPQVQAAVGALMKNLGGQALPYSLASQFLGETGLTGEQAINRRIQKVLDDYVAACKGGARD
jgi:D-tagatose-1,6-bisphosphate aldolase subunit GatZ/KbaZ